MSSLTPVIERPSVAGIAEPISRRVSGRFYHPELDVLRFFAFFMVFLHHTVPHEIEFWTKLGVWTPVGKVVASVGSMGAFGVDVFFALSSYLITELLLREKDQTGDVDLRAFYARRILRIWPLYFVFLGFSFALTFVLPGQHIGARAMAAFLLLGGNWWVVLHGFPSSIIFPLWSVSIEEQFYVTWPAIARRVSARGMAIAAAVMLAIATATRFYLGAHDVTETHAWCNTLVQLDPIALGILAAVGLRGRAPELGRYARLAVGAAGTALLWLGGNYWVIKGDPLTTARLVMGYPAVALGSIALLIAVLRDGGSKPNVALVYLGRVSYGLYVFHVLGLMISDYTVADPTASLARYVWRVAVALVVTIVLAAASYRWLETPFLRIKQRFAHVLSRPGG